MADQSKFEAMLEKLIADDRTGAEELFHEIVVEKSRDIYENLLKDDVEEVEVDEASKEDAKEEDKVEEKTKEDAEDKVEEKTEESEDEAVEEASEDKADEEKTDEATKEDDESVDEDITDEVVEPAIEGDDDMGGDAADAMIGDIEMGDKEGGDDEDKEDLEDRVADLEDTFDDLKAEFDAMMDEKGEDGDDDAEMDADAEDEGEEGEEEKEDEAVVIAPESDLEAEAPAFESKDQVDVMREYVNKVTPKMGDNGDNTKSPVAGKNDMGGDASNIAGGGEETGGKADSPKEDNAGNVNVPGGKASKSMKASKGHGAEKKGAGEKGADSKSTIGS